jgi:hypothetical protein
MPAHATREASKPAPDLNGHSPEAYTIQSYNRYWAVRDSSGTLICVTVYKRGAKEVIRRLSAWRHCSTAERQVTWSGRLHPTERATTRGHR